MKYVVEPKKKYLSGYCLVCAGNCHNDCGKQIVCQYALEQQ